MLVEGLAALTERLAVDCASGSLKIDLHKTQHNIIIITVYCHTEVSLEAQCSR